MDYEKAYKAAKRLAAHWIENGCEATERILLTTIFPELKENADERIRSCIELALTDVNEQRFTDFGVTLKDCLTYLKKRKEQKPAERIEYSVKFKEGFKAGRESGLCDGQKYVLDNLDSYGLCKPAEWSEEDENAMTYFHELIGFGVTEKFCDAQTASDMRNWLNTRLKSLRPQSHWKPKGQQLDCACDA